MSGPNLENYIEVHERIQSFYAKYPDGSLGCGRWYTDTIGEQTYLIYQAFAYRHPKDECPGEGWAWEPVPGKTPYTNGSELMVAETSAWGRALAALGFEVKRGVASKEEVAARTNGEPVATRNNASATTPASEKQVPAARKALKASNLSTEAQEAIWKWGLTAPKPDGKGNTLGRPAADAILDAAHSDRPDLELAALAKRAGYSDVPPPDDVPDETVPGDAEKVEF